MKVTVITPTTHERGVFNERIMQIISEQDYPNIEHIFDYGDGNIGQKRNRLCEAATGDIILHADSDDHYASDWVTRSVMELLLSSKQLTGLSAFKFYEPETGKYYKYTYPNNENLAGATFCYFKSLWQARPFEEIQVGEDSLFLRGIEFHSHNYVDGFCATIHAGNSSPKNISGERWE